MSKQPSISQYLVSTCLHVIDELNDQYAYISKDRSALREIANNRYNEMDITVRIGYPFRHMAHFTVGDKKEKSNEGKQTSSKSNHDIYVESKDFKIEVKYLKNWESSSKTLSVSAQWKNFQADFDWLFDEIDKGNKHKRAFVIGWFNCVHYFAQMIQLGEGPGGKPKVNDSRASYFPFLRKTRAQAYTSDLEILYERAYEVQPINLVGTRKGEYNCIFIGSEKDVFHFAVFF